MAVGMLARLQDAARRIRHDALTVYFVARDPRTPMLVRLLALAIAAYAFSPIDLIPDFIPVLGYLDDLILLPLGILLILRLTPPDILAASRVLAHAAAAKPASILAAVVIVAIWVLCTAGFAWWLFGAASR